MRQHELVVQRRAPAHQRAVERLAPEPGDERAHQQLLREAHPGVRRHLEGAELDEAEPARGAVGRPELVDADLGAMRVAGDVDEQVAEQPVHHPGPDVGLARARHLAQRDLHLVEPVMPGLVDARRLAGRADIHAGEHHRQAGMALPVEDDALQEVRAAHEGRVVRRRAAQHHMVAAAGPRVPAVGHELVGAEPHGTRVVVEAAGDLDRVVPPGRGLDVDLDDPGVGRDLDDVEARIEGRVVALDVHRQAEVGRRALDRRQEFEIVLQAVDRRHEHAELPVARLDREGGPDLGVGAAVRLRPRRVRPRRRAIR